MTPDRPSIEAEIDELENAATEYRFCQCESEECGHGKRHTAAREALLSRFLEQQRDSERLDWLEQNPEAVTPEVAVDPSWNMEGFHDEVDGWADTDKLRWYRTLREAIDAAAIQPGGTPQK